MIRPVPPVWRSILYVPGNVPKFIDKAHERGADCVLVDLEDSVQLAQKPEARAMLAGTLSKVARGGADVAVRINRPLRLAVPTSRPRSGPASRPCSSPRPRACSTCACSTRW